MALSDLAVYSEYAYSTMTEVLAQQIELFNAASEGTIILAPGDNQGDFSDIAFFKKISGLVQRRDAYGSGANATAVLQHLVDTMVKVAASTKTVSIDPGMFTWIQQNPEVAGVVLGEQLAKDMLADMLNTGILAAYAAMVQTSAILYNATSDTPDTLTPAAMLKASRKLGDRAQEIAAWISHSVPYFDMLGTNVANGANLFTYGTVAIQRDALGRPIIVTDSASLIDTVANPDTYHCLGLVPGAVIVQQNNDFMANTDMTNGQVNLSRTYQAEWTYNVGVKGYAWDKTSGGKSPTTAAVGTSANWDKYATDNKDGPGVILKVDFAA